MKRTPGPLQGNFLKKSKLQLSISFNRKILDTMEFLIVPFDSALQYESNRYHISFYLSPHPIKTQFSWHVPMFGSPAGYALRSGSLATEIED